VLPTWHFAGFLLLGFFNRIIYIFGEMQMDRIISIPEMEILVNRDYKTLWVWYSKNQMRLLSQMEELEIHLKLEDIPLGIQHQ
jgi:hypothetical protein